MNYNLLQIVYDKESKIFQLYFTEHHVKGPLLNDPMLPRGLYNFSYLYYEKSCSQHEAKKILFDEYTKFINSMICDLENCLNEYKFILPESRGFIRKELES